MRNKKGITELGIVVVQALIIGASYVAQVGVFSSDPTSLGFAGAVHGLTAYSQMPHVKRDHREDIATKICVFNGGDEATCRSVAVGLSDADLLWEVKDGNPANDAYYTDQWQTQIGANEPKAGGGLRKNILALQ